MSLSAARYQLANAFKSLKQEWEATESVWRDVVRRGFAKDYFDPLAARLACVLTAMDRCDESLDRMSHDCADR
jgi:hypothetical protein